MADEPLSHRCIVGYLWYWSNGVLIHVNIWATT